MREASVSTVLGVVALWVGLAQAQEAVVVPVPQHAATISPVSAEFHVPLRAQETWAWNIGSAGVLEYGWLVEVAAGGERFRVGVQIWHEPESEPTVGPLAELLKSGQLGVWPAERSSGPTLEGLTLVAEPGDGVVVLRIDDLKTLSWLKEIRPRTVRLITVRGHGPHPDQRFAREWAQVATVIYRD
jgi:hypothetical protein